MTGIKVIPVVSVQGLADSLLHALFLYHSYLAHFKESS